MVERQCDQHIGRLDHHARTVANQLVGSGRSPIVNSAGHRHERHVAHDGLVDGEQRATALARFDHDHHLGEGRDQPISERESVRLG